MVHQNEPKKIKKKQIMNKGMKQEKCHPFYSPNHEQNDSSNVLLRENPLGEKTHKTNN
jgi:hypothetical protein